MVQLNKEGYLVAMLVQLAFNLSESPTVTQTKHPTHPHAPNLLLCVTMGTMSVENVERSPPGTKDFKLGLRFVQCPSLVFRGPNKSLLPVAFPN